MPFKTIKKLFETYERLLMPATLLLGTAVDFVTFKTLNVETTFWILGIYYVIAAVCIFVLNTVRYERLRMVAKFLIQFTFGALLSSSLVFYWFSGALSASWPIMILLALLMVSNEVFNQYYLKPLVQIGLYYFISFSLFALALPYAFNSLDPILFVAAGVFAFVPVWIISNVLAKYVQSIQQIQRRILFVMATIFISMNALYVLNVIPPIPLSLREAGVYHKVERNGNRYVALAEKESWLDQVIPGQVLHVPMTNRVYVFSAIFAPLKLKTTIVHRWQYFDPIQKKWIDKNRSSFTLSGGRDEGYRGYSLKSNLVPGKWRVRMETERGQVIGRIGFVIKVVEALPKLIEEVK
jgi:hypothetical protein